MLFIIGAVRFSVTLRNTQWISLRSVQVTISTL